MISWILNFLNKIRWFPFYFITPLPYTIGNASEQILLAASKAIKENKQLIILYTEFFAKKLKYSICNKCLFKDLLIKKSPIRKISFIKFFLEIEFFLQRILVLLNDYSIKLKLKENIRFLNVGIFETYETQRVATKTLLEKNYSQIPKFNINYKILDIKSNTKKKCESILKKIDIDKNRNIVCLHVRDSKFRKDQGKKDYRNSNINNYIKSIKYLIKKDYQVVRLGRAPSRKINFKNKNFFDYSASKVQSDEMDLFLIKKSKFYIGTQSGILDVAYMFNKPVLTTNMVEMFNSFPRKINDRGIFKKILKKNGETVPLKSYINLPHSSYHIPENPVKDLQFKQNTSSEILESVIEFEYNLKKKNVTSLQKKFKKKLNTSYKNLITNSIRSKKIFSYNDAIKQIRMFKSSQGSFCQFFLKKNF